MSDPLFYYLSAVIDEMKRQAPDAEFAIFAYDPNGVGDALFVFDGEHDRMRSLLKEAIAKFELRYHPAPKAVQ